MRKEREDSADEIVNVQLFFNSPITHQQIDRFVQLGGEITYTYRALAHGWTGRIQLSKIDLLPVAMGPTLMLVEEPPRIELHLDTATQIGRVRPVWRENFAGNPVGFDGDESITIGIIDTGIDANHPDLAGQWIDWSDHSDDKHDSPMDMSGHGSHVAGIVAGSGKAGNSAGEVLRWTDVAEPNSFSVGLYRIPLTNESRSLITTPYFTSQGGATVIPMYYWLNPPFDDGVTTFHYEFRLRSGEQRTSFVPTDHPGDDYHECAYFASADENLVVANSITPYSPVGDGFNRFRGVAPGCRVAAAKIFLDDPDQDSIWEQGALTDLADRRKELRLKIVNLSLGVKGMRVISDSLRECIHNTVRNGIVVVSSAGNDGDRNTPEQRQIHDPGRAAFALTVGAVNDGNRLTEYSSHGFDPNHNNPVAQQEDYKPDVIAPGGSNYYMPRFSGGGGWPHRC